MAQPKQKVILNELPTPLDFEIGGQHVRIPTGQSEGVVSEDLRKALEPFGARVRILAAG